MLAPNRIGKLPNLATGFVCKYREVHHGASTLGTLHNPLEGLDPHGRQELYEQYDMQLTCGSKMPHEAVKKVSR